MNFISLLVLISLSLQCFAQDNENIIEFAANNGLIKRTLEKDYPRLSLKTFWQVEKSVEFNQVKLHVLKLVTINSDNNEILESSNHYEVVAEVKEKLMLFEKAFILPEKMELAIGGLDTDSPNGKVVESRDLYYVELKGESLIDALKSVFVEIPYYGFSGYVIEAEKYGFDMTPGRNWRVIHAKYSLSRGMSAEAGDIRPYHFDDNFKKAFEGASKFTLKNGNQEVLAAQVNPWGTAFIRKVNLPRTGWANTAKISEGSSKLVPIKVSEQVKWIHFLNTSCNHHFR